MTFPWPREHKNQSTHFLHLFIGNNLIKGCHQANLPNIKTSADMVSRIAQLHVQIISVAFAAGAIGGMDTVLDVLRM